MKYKYIIVIFLAGVIIQIFAALQKIMHTPVADTAFKVSTGIIILSIVLGIIKVISTKEKDSFLNK